MKRRNDADGGPGKPGKEPTIYHDQITPADDVVTVDGFSFVRRFGEPMMRVVERGDRPPAPQSRGERAEAEHGRSGEPLEDILRREREGAFPEKTPEERRRERDRR